MRAEGWESLLAEYLENPHPFQWGTNDCVLFAAEWVRLCTGIDHAAGVRGKYSTAKGAKIKMTRAGFPDAAAVADARLVSKPVGFAQRGDIVLHPSGASASVTG